MSVARRSGKKGHSAIFLIILALVVGFSCYTLFNQQLVIDSLNDDSDKAAERLERVREENEALKQEKEKLNDPDYLEKIAREDLGMTRQGELPYIYVRKQQ